MCCRPGRCLRLMSAQRSCQVRMQQTCTLATCQLLKFLREPFLFRLVQGPAKHHMLKTLGDLSAAEGKHMSAGALACHR